MGSGEVGRCHLSEFVESFKTTKYITERQTVCLRKLKSDPSQEE